MRVAVVLLPLILSGCIGDFIAPPDDTTRQLACGVLYPDVAGRLDLVLHEPKDASVDLLPTLGWLADRLHEHTPRTPETTYSARQDLEAEAASWSLEDLQEAYAEHSFSGLGRVQLTLVAVESVEGLDEVGIVVRPGTVAIQLVPLREAADSLGVEPDVLARWVVLHYAGHALGVVNGGIPMQEKHEGLPRHESDPESVMHPSWHLPSKRVQMPGEAPDYSPQVIADWQGAEAVCL